MRAADALGEQERAVLVGVGQDERELLAADAAHVVAEPLGLQRGLGERSSAPRRRRGGRGGR